MRYIILDESGEIKPLLEQYCPGISQEIANLLQSETPSDIYDSIVSSSFDADRLDYLRRDRLMTGTGAGAIDFDWLMENLRIETIDVDPVSDQPGPGTPRLSLCLDQKALEAAEAFLLARFHLYTQVYLHKATRAIGQMLGALLGQVAAAVEQQRFDEIGLDRDHPLARFYRSTEDETKAYLALDDTVIWSAVQGLSASKDAFIGDLATRIRNRRLYKVLDIENAFPDSAEQQRRAIRRIRQNYADSLNRTVLQDVVKVNIYGTVGADDEQAQKRLMIFKGGELREITELSNVVKAVGERSFTRFFFAGSATRDQAAGGAHR